MAGQPFQTKPGKQAPLGALVARRFPGALQTHRCPGKEQASLSDINIQVSPNGRLPNL